MSQYGFNFETLYHLELETLYDLCQFIRGDDSKISPDYDVLIRGVLLPFFRDSTKTTRKSDKNTIMRLALVATAKKIGMELEDWDKLSTNHIARIVRRHVQNLIVQKIDTLSPEEKEEVLGLAQNNLRESAKILGVPLTGAGAVLAGEMSGFSIYLATTTGLKALSSALGITFSWGVYQGATSLLGVILGPVGWAITGFSLAGGTVVAVRGWLRGKREQKLVLVVITLLFTIGDSPFEFFGVKEDGSFTDVKKSYRAVMKSLHPDKLEPDLPQWLQDDFHEKLLRCQEAFKQTEKIFEQT